MSPNAYVVMIFLLVQIKNEFKREKENRNENPFKRQNQATQRSNYHAIVPSTMLYIRFSHDKFPSFYPTSSKIIILNSLEFIMTQAIDSQTVAQYLINHPDFFENHADILSDLRLMSPVIGKTISLHERQIEVLRNKYKTLEQHLSTLAHTAQDNKNLMEKMVNWMVLLLEETHKADLPQTIVNGLKTVFNIPETTLRLWNIRHEYADSWFAQPVDGPIRDATNNMQNPYCGPVQETQDAIKWLDHFADMHSVALIPLKKDVQSLPFGLIVMGSPDINRFQNDMATDFLTAIGKLAYATLRCLVLTD